MWLGGQRSARRRHQRPCHVRRLVGRNHSGYLALLANDYLGSLNVAFNLTVDLQHAAADNLQSLANDPKIVPDHRLLGT